MAGKICKLIFSVQSIHGTGHYLDAKYINTLLYEGNAVDEFVDWVDSWLKGSK
ncbi:MAG TPA: hypothetical protein VMT35_06880 [Ignavibacteriaceae bacterium]|nr:hypothetical protein [Ignavibacteriaceae bacterium]